MNTLIKNSILLLNDSIDKAIKAGSQAQMKNSLEKIMSLLNGVELLLNQNDIENLEHEPIVNELAIKIFNLEFFIQSTKIRSLKKLNLLFEKSLRYEIFDEKSFIEKIPQDSSPPAKKL